MEAINCNNFQHQTCMHTVPYWQYNSILHKIQYPLNLAYKQWFAEIWCRIPRTLRLWIDPWSEYCSLWSISLAEHRNQNCNHMKNPIILMHWAWWTLILSQMSDEVTLPLLVEKNETRLKHSLKVNSNTITTTMSQHYLYRTNRKIFALHQSRRELLGSSMIERASAIMIASDIMSSAVSAKNSKNK